MGRRRNAAIFRTNSLLVWARVARNILTKFPSLKMMRWREFSMPLFTVVIPAFNREKLILPTLESALNQTFSDFEIIVVDDGSRDRTAEVAAGLSPKIRVIRKANGGVGSARNAGIREATGDYVAFLDSDDLWFPWTLATYAEAVRLHAPARIFAKFAEVKSEDDLGRIAHVAPTFHPYDDYISTHFLGFDPYPSACVVRTADLRATGGFFEHRHHMEEADCWLRLGDKPGYVRVEGTPCCAHVWHEDNASNRSSTFKIGMHYLMRTERQGGYPGGPGKQWHRRRKIASAIRTGSFWCLKDGDVKGAMGLYADSLVWNVRLGKLPYVAAFPILATASGLGLYVPR